MTTLLITAGIILGIAATAIWSLITLREVADQHHARLTDAERRAYAAGYDQATADHRRTSGLKPRHTVTTFAPDITQARHLAHHS